MGRQNLATALTTPDTYSTADLSGFRLPTVPTAVADYVVARHVPGPVAKTVLTVTALPLTLTANGTTSAGGGVKVLSFQQGYIKPCGATSSLAVANAGGDGSFLASIGTAAAGTDGTLTSTEANFAASTAATVASGVGTCKMKQDATTAVDGTSSALDLYLNSCLNADGTGKLSLTYTGTITILWSDLGDN